MEASEPKWVDPNVVNTGLTHLGSEASKYSYDMETPLEEWVNFKNYWGARMIV